jgi:hypothetical protein
MNAKRIGIALLGTLLLAAGGCGKAMIVGTPAAPSTAATPLATILASPDQFEGQTVVLKGVVQAQCAARCDFTYAEGAQSVTVYTGDPKPPRIQSGRAIRVTAQVHKGDKQVVITAKGLEILPGKAQP